MLIPTYFCDCCGHAFSHPDATFVRDKCPKCGDFNFELLITTNDRKKQQESTPNKNQRQPLLWRTPKWY
jgi:predicted  nucleic acid-binding Zn-ribbon protein